MNYRGYEIEDNHYNDMSQELGEFEDGNYTTLDWDDLEDLQKEIVKKMDDLILAGKTFKDVKIGFWAVDDEYNPDGSDTWAEGSISIVWKELETPRQKEQRIDRAKKAIDKDIEDRKRMDEARRHVADVEITRAIQLLAASGYTVTKN